MQLDLELIDSIMDKQKIDENDIAAYTNVNRKTVFRWLSGRAFPKIDKLKKLYKVLGTEKIVKNERNGAEYMSVKTRYQDELKKAGYKSVTLNSRDQALIRAFLGFLDEREASA